MGILQEMQRRYEMAQRPQCHIRHLAECDVRRQREVLALHLELLAREVGCGVFGWGDEGGEDGHSVEVEVGQEGDDDREGEEEQVAELDKVVVPLKTI